MTSAVDMPADPTVEVRTLQADRGDARQRLDHMLCRHLHDVPGLSRAWVQRAVTRGLVSVNGVRATRSAQRTAVGDVVVVALQGRRQREVMAPEAGDLDVVYEDDALLVVNKPAGLVAHPTYRHQHGTLMNRLLARATTWPDGQRPSLVGRLDKLTSGLVLVAKSARVHAALQRALQPVTAVKAYVALVHGVVPAGVRTIALPLMRDPADRRRVVAHPDGAHSVTVVERVGVAHATDGAPAVSLVRCHLRTGRTHQIRVHLATSGWPILGDPVYGCAASDDAAALPSTTTSAHPLTRQALHASALACVHPTTGQPLRVTAPLPDDMRALVAALGL